MIHARPGLAAAVLIVLVSALAPASEAYVRTTSYRGTPLRWPGSCVVFFPDAAGSARVSGDAALEAILAAADTWNRVPGAYLEVLIGPPQPDLEPWLSRGGPNQSIIKFEEREWSHDIYAVALTFITYQHSEDPAEDGRIIDADILLNAEEYNFGVAGHPGRHDIQALVTHEMGHALGLDHPCDDGAVTPIPVDHTGAYIPLCDSTLPASMLETTMFNRVERGETKKRTLEPDDVAGLEAIYPLSADPGKCTDADDVLDALGSTPRGCRCQQGETPFPWLAGMLLLWIWWARRRGRGGQG